MTIYPYNLAILAVFCLSFSFSVPCLGQPDREAYLWKKGTVKIAKDSIAACDASLDLGSRYLKFAQLASPHAAFLYRDFAKYKEIKLEKFKRAAQRFAEAERHYKAALAAFEDSRKGYERVKASASRATNKTLHRYRSSIVKRQFKDAKSLYSQAKELMILGNRAFNAANRYFNQAVDKAILRLGNNDDDLKKRLKYHRWPSAH